MTNMICFDCLGDGKETCHNPDHGFIDAMSWDDIGRHGCPVCGHHPQHKVGTKRPGGPAPCDTCHGIGEVSVDINRDFCKSVGYDFEDMLGLLMSFAINNPNQPKCTPKQNETIFSQVHPCEPTETKE